MPVAKKH